MKWLSFHIGGQKWGLYLVNPGHKRLKGEPDEQVHGMTYYDECRIYLARGTSQEAFEDTLVHELLHAILGVSGASDAMDSYHGLEESIVRDVTPLLHRLLKDLGMKFPKVNP